MPRKVLQKIPSRMGLKRVHKNKVFSGKFRGRRLGQIAELIDVVPFVKWLYFDGLLTAMECQAITGIGRRTIRDLISMNSDDPPLEFCERDGCYMRLTKHRRNCKRCRVVEAKVSVRDLLIKPCLRYAVCHRNVLKTSETGLCGQCRQTLPSYKARRDQRQAELIAGRAAGIIPPVAPARFCALEGCKIRLKHNNKSGFCYHHKPKKKPSNHAQARGFRLENQSLTDSREDADSLDY